MEINRVTFETGDPEILVALKYECKVSKYLVIFEFEVKLSWGGIILAFHGSIYPLYSIRFRVCYIPFIPSLQALFNLDFIDLLSHWHLLTPLNLLNTLLPLPSSLPRSTLDQRVNLDQSPPTPQPISYICPPLNPSTPPILTPLNNPPNRRININPLWTIIETPHIINTDATGTVFTRDVVLDDLSHAVV